MPSQRLRSIKYVSQIYDSDGNVIQTAIFTSTIYDFHDFFSSDEPQCNARCVPLLFWSNSISANILVERPVKWQRPKLTMQTLRQPLLAHSCITIYKCNIHNIDELAARRCHGVVDHFYLCVKIGTNLQHYRSRNCMMQCTVSYYTTFTLDGAVVRATWTSVSGLARFASGVTYLIAYNTNAGRAQVKWGETTGKRIQQKWSGGKRTTRQRWRGATGWRDHRDAQAVFPLL